MPSEAKKIHVDSKSVLDLKAIVYAKEQERTFTRQSRKRRLPNNHTTTNAGLEARKEKDEDEFLNDSERNKKRKSVVKLQEKAKMYDALAEKQVEAGSGGTSRGGSGGAQSSSSFVLGDNLVDFTKKVNLLIIEIISIRDCIASVKSLFLLIILRRKDIKIIPLRWELQQYFARKKHGFKFKMNLDGLEK